MLFFYNFGIIFLCCIKGQYFTTNNNLEGIMRITLLKKLLNSTLAFSIATSGCFIPNSSIYAQKVQTEVGQEIKEILSVDFSNYPIIKEGWEVKADTKPYASGITSSKSLKLNKSGYYAQTPQFKLEKDAILTFYTKGYSTNSTTESILKVQALMNGTWTDIHTLTTFDIANFIKTEVIVPQTATKVKILLETKGAFNIALDGIVLTGTGPLVEGGTEETPETPDHEEVTPPTNGETTTPPTESKPDADAYGELVISGASTLEVGMNSTLQVTNQEGQTLSDVKFESTVPSVLTVDQAGKMNAVAEGITQISATTMIDGKKYIGQKRIDVTKAGEYPVTVFDEGFKEFPNLPQGWSTNLTDDIQILVEILLDLH